MAKSLFPEFDGDDAADRSRGKEPAAGPPPAPVPMPGVARVVPPPPKLRPDERPLPGLEDERSPVVATPDPAPLEPTLLTANDLAAMFTGEGINAVESDEDLVPARMLNEFAYCPRLAYLEWVQGEFEDNLETREGTFAHRRVDKPTRTSFALPEADESSGGESATSDPDGADQPLTADRLAARALMLSAHSEGLVAKLDLLELNIKQAVPVDHKRGKVPENEWQSWEPERVQLCEQGLILRANGYDCDHGVLYFVESRRRVRVDFDDALVARTRSLVAEMRGLASWGTDPAATDRQPQVPALLARGHMPAGRNKAACGTGGRAIRGRTRDTG